MHRIFVPQENKTIHSAMYGVILYIPYEQPMGKDLEECCNLKITEEKEWDPYDKIFEVREEVLTISFHNHIWENPLRCPLWWRKLTSKSAEAKCHQKNWQPCKKHIIDHTAEGNVPLLDL